MENVNTILTEDVFELYDSLQWGSVNVRFNNISGLELFQELINLANVIRPDIIEMNPAVDLIPADGGLWDEVPVEGVYTIVYKSRNIPLPALSPDDLTIVRHAKFAAEKEVTVNLNINPSLFKYAKKVAIDHGIKFKALTEGQVFDGRKKSVSVYRRIEDAIRAKADKIEVDESEVAIQTVRVYASQLSAYRENKIRVSAADGKIILYFNPVSKRELYQKETAALFNKMVEEIGQEEAVEVIKELIVGDGGQYEIPVEEIGQEEAVEVPTTSVIHKEDVDF